MTENQKEFETMMYNGSKMGIWKKVSQPPKSALKLITGGRLKNKTDINPQWRYQALTELFGPVGMGWKYEIVSLWTVPGSDGQVFAFAKVLLFVREVENLWSEPIPGVGGNMLIEKQTAGLYHNDEAYKMAITDALSVACKMLGLAADIYAGRWEWDGEKYIAEPVVKKISQKQYNIIQDLVNETETDLETFLNHAGVSELNKIQVENYEYLVGRLNAKKSLIEKEKTPEPGSMTE